MRDRESNEIQHSDQGQVEPPKSGFRYECRCKVKIHIAKLLNTQPNLDLMTSQKFK